MIDERTRFLKFKALASAFVMTTILANIVNYLITFPDDGRSAEVSSFTFVAACLLLSFVCYSVLSARE